MDLVNYNWYDSTDLFSGPNLDVMKDAENQYYYISGRLTYGQLPSGMVFCQEEESTINTETGPKTITIYKNQPCVQIDSYIGPKTGVKFYREFNDGPYSSGDFTSTVKQSYMDWDKSRLSKTEYFGNAAPFFSYDQIIGTGDYAPLVVGDIQYDIQGEYNINAEYQSAPMPYDCAGKYQIMRVGDVRTRSQCVKYDINNNCIQCKDTLTTGLKYALLELDSEIWEDRLAYVLTNPPTTLERTAKRGLNLTTQPYLSYVLGGELIAARPDVTYGYVWYAGPPQQGDTDLPFFAFTESFQSTIYGSGASLTLYPAIGSSVGGGGDSSRSYSVSPIVILSGKDDGAYTVQGSYETDIYPKVLFNQNIPAYIAGDDDIKAKVFGMGNAFSGKYVIKAVDEENAGYFYSGYTFTSGKTTYTGNELNLINNYAGFKVGSSYNQIKYISGYTGAGLLEMNRMYAHDNSGTQMEYYYFDNRLLPNGVTIKQTGWTEFSPLPSEVEADNTYGRQYATQDVENQSQRYYKGPYASYVNKFLYPNAKATSLIYDTKQGFPTKFRYKVRVREETVKELYCKFQISQGNSYNTPTFIPVVRPVESNFGTNQPVMVTMFNAGGYNFDFNQWNVSKINFKYTRSLDTAVDADYAPPTDSYHPTVDSTVYIYCSGKNGLTYVNAPEFIQGILLTGIDAVLHRSYSGSLYRESGAFWLSPSPAAVGLYHNFTGYDITGELVYTKPIYNLQSGIIDRNQMMDSLPLFRTGCTAYRYCPLVGSCSDSIAEGINKLYTKQMDGKIFYSNIGQDPFFFQDMGGRRGSSTATGQGGYHPKGIIGDNWIGLSTRLYGYKCAVTSDTCGDNIDGTIEGNYGTEAYTNDNRIADQDKYWFLFNVTPNFTTIYTRALEYNPMVYDYVNRPFTSASTAPASSSSKVSFTYQNSSKSFYFDLNSYFKTRSLASIEEWYVNPSGSGLVIGPFDRDVEFFVNTGNILTGYNYLYINQRKLSDYASGSDDGAAAACEAPKKPAGTVIDYGIGEFKNIKPLIYIPSGSTATINVKGIETGGYPYGSTAYGSTPYTGNPPCSIGFPSKSYIHIRARQVLNECRYGDDLLSYFGVRGSNYWLHNRNMINNGSERTYQFATPDLDIASLKGNTYTYITYSRTGKLYPKPDYSEFIAYRVEDAGGNESYSIKDMDEFYRKKTAKENSLIYYSGWREGSRVSFEFVEMEPVLDSIPYESHTIVIPSGNCVVSGEMGYLGQADSAIFTEGVSLVDETTDDLIKENLYGPRYVSDTLKRVPFFDYPTGDYEHPVLDAPSMMKQRLVSEIISPEQEYSGINTFSPYNYNKFLWPAYSDLKKLNPTETLEDLPPDDGNTFLNSTMLISASQGQDLSNGTKNPDCRKVYTVRNQYQLYDSVATDALINYGYFITSGYGFQTQLKQPESGVIVPRGTTLTEIKNELI